MEINNSSIKILKKLLILNKKHKILSDISIYKDYEICLLPNEFTIKQIEETCKNYSFITMEIILFHLNSLEEKNIDEFINNFLVNNVHYDEIITPIGTIPLNILEKFKIQEFSINNLIIQSMQKEKIPIPITATFNNNFVQLHKIECIFKNSLDSILLLIMKKESFLLESLLQYVLYFNLYTKKGLYLKEIIIFNNVEDGLKLLEENHWIIPLHKVKESLNNNIIYKKITICTCSILDIKNIEKEFFFQLQKEQKKKVTITPINFEKRRLNLILKKPEEINNPLEFYKRKILKCTSTINTYKNTNSKLAIKRKKLYSELNIFY